MNKTENSESLVGGGNEKTRARDDTVGGYLCGFIGIMRIENTLKRTSQSRDI